MVPARLRWASSLRRFARVDNSINNFDRFDFQSTSVTDLGLTPVGSERSARTRLWPFAHSPPRPPLVRPAAPRTPRKHAHGGRAGQRHQASPPGAPAPARSCERNLELPRCAWQRPDGRWLSSQSLRCCWRSPHLVGRPLERNSGARAPRGVCMSAGCVWRETDKRREHRI